MFRNYFTIAWRNLTRNRLSSVINIGGLAIGMSVAILIGLWVSDETGFNHRVANHRRIAAVLQIQDFNGEIDTWWGEALQLGPALRSGYADLFKHVVMSGWNGDHLLGVGYRKIKTGGNYMDSGVLEMLTPKMVAGNYSGLREPGSVVLSLSAARSLFGNAAAAMGQVVVLDTKIPVKVTGVYEDLPDNSDYGATKFIVPWRLLLANEGYEKKLGWGNSWFQCLVQLNEGVDLAKASRAIRDVKLKASPGDAKFKPQLVLHPMDRWHLYGEWKEGKNNGGAIVYVRLFMIIGAFVLLLACINFMNLSTARSERRAREVGIRKAIGSLRGQLIGQFFSESVLVAVLAYVLAVGLVLVLLPFFNEVAGKKVSIPWGQPLFWLAGIGFALFTGLVAGSYPALYLSSFQPVKVLKGTFRVGRLAAVPRKVLVVVQFSVSVILIIGTLGVFRQIGYVRERPVGYTREGLVTVPVGGAAISQHKDAFRADLLSTGVVEEAAFSESPLTAAYVTNSGYKWRGKDPNMTEQFHTVRVSPEYGRVARWQVVQGRDFSRAFATDSLGFVINESAARYMGFSNPVGERVQWGDNGVYTIIGVVKDMIMQSPFEPATAMIFFLDTARTPLVDVRIRPGVSAAAAIGKIAGVYKKYDTDNPFEYRFVDEEYGRKFATEVRIGRLAGFFTGLAIFISCLGLFGLATFVAEQRTREIGVRKVLGASLGSLWALLSQEFVKLVVLSLLIGGPLAWWIMQGWLAGYTYHTSLSWWIFAVAGTGAVVITLLTVSWQAVKAAMESPVKSLRSE
ncbi:ABC transporter permease [Puia sp. P3]|uniref:ABC transporter permease n=1 Tax=Puia sp. P3 TaxID=3423952 RepID=UPI003D6665F3